MVMAPTDADRIIVNSEDSDVANMYQKCCFVTLIEPRCEKTGLRGFRPGPTQTGLRSHRTWLKA